MESKHFYITWYSDWYFSYIDAKGYKENVYVNFCRYTASTCRSSRGIYVIEGGYPVTCIIMSGSWNSMYAQETTYGGSKFLFNHNT